EFLKKFSVGYAPETRDGLLRHLRKLGYADSMLKEAGLIAGDDRGYRDWFRGRIMFPIYTMKGDVAGFGGRVMDDSQPKYLNSTETEVFKKSDMLFGIHLAKDDIRKKGHALIVEGYLDVIVCHQFGFANTVAPLVTAHTGRQLRKLKLLAKQSILVFDGDSAGTAAARRSLALICENDLRAGVMLLPQGDDPDSFLRKKGSDALRKSLACTMTAMEFVMKTAVGDRADAVREALGLVASMNDNILADELLHDLSDRSGIHEPVLRSELEKFRRKAASRPGTGVEPSLPAKPPREECLLLSAIIARPEKAAEILSELDIDDLKADMIRSIFHKLKTVSGGISPASLLNAGDEKEKALIRELTLEPGFDIDHIDRNIADCLQTIKRKMVEEKRRLAAASENAEILNSLLKEKRKLIKG
ncbi:MAG: toprim domain-containing protein, partial [Nitrospirota bacterium]